MRITAFAMLLVVAGSAHAQPANRPTPSAKTSPATAPVKDEAAQRKLDEAAAAGGQQKLADEKLARTEAQWKKVMRSICTGC